jgi:hypothetical protein
MTDDDLLKELERVGHARRQAPPPDREAIWQGIQAGRPHMRRDGSRRRTTIALLAAAASLALLAVGIRAHERDQRRSSKAMAVASAMVIQRHLAQSDAMIGAFRSAVASGTWDGQLTERARDLELATRRIQGGRIEADSALVGLLADLDLVLTEIAGYGDLSARRAAESEMIEYSIAARQVVPRMHAWADTAARATNSEGLDP